MNFSSVRLALLAGTALGLSPSPLLASTQIGKAAAVNPMAQGHPPAQESRVLAVGVDMAANERVVTGPRGQTQLLFLDGSALTVGPNSDVVLDEFVYDPETRSGKLAFSATKGVFRLVGGQLSKQTPVLIRTPTATVGVRGGIAIAQVGENGGVEATFLFGDRMTVESGGGSSTATRPGFSIVAPAGGPPGDPTPADEGALAASLGQFEGNEGDTGGVEQPPADEDVAQTQIGQSNSGQGGGAPSGSPPPSAPGGQEATDASQTETTTSAMNMASQSPADGGDGTPPSPPDGPPAIVVPPPAGLSVAGVFSGRFKGAPNPSLGTSDGTPALDIGFIGGVAIDGIFSGGDFALTIADGDFTVPPTATPFGGPFQGSGRLSPNRDFAIYELANMSDGARLFGFAGKPAPAGSIPNSGAGFYTLRRDFVLDSDIPFLRGIAGGDMAFAAPAMGYVDWGARGGSDPQFVSSRIVIDGQGAGQISGASVLIGRVSGQGDPLTADLDFRFRGSSRPDAADGVFIFHNAGGAGSELQRDGGGFGFFGTGGPDHFVLGAATGIPAQQLGAGGSVFYIPNVAATATAGVRGPQTDQRNLRGFVGGLAYETDSAFNVTKVYALQNRNATDLAMFQFTTDAFYGTLSGVADLVEDGFGYGSIAANFGGIGAGQSAFFDNDTFAAAESGSAASRNGVAAADHRFFMTGSASLETRNLVPDGVSLCACQFLEWGFLSADIVATSFERTQVHLANWVAGDVPTASSLPADGVATYSGHAIGNVFNGAASYTAVGGFALTFDFGLPTSSQLTISNFDGATYVANVSNFAGDPAIFNGNATAGDRNLAYKATFFQGAADTFIETGGRFAVAGGGGYAASGIFAGARTSYVPPN